MENEAVRKVYPSAIIFHPLLPCFISEAVELIRPKLVKQGQVEVKAKAKVDKKLEYIMGEMYMHSLSEYIISS